MSSKSNAMRELFDFVPPHTLRKSVNTVFFNYLDAMDEVPEDFQKTAQDIHALIQFLDKAAEDSQ